MSWDVYAQDFPPAAKSVSDIPDDFKPASIGMRSCIIRKIEEIVPFSDFSNPSLGKIRSSKFSIEVALGDEEELMGVTFFVRGSDEAAGVISDILKHLALRAVDTGTGDFFDHERAVQALQKWRVYRDQITSARDAQNLNAPNEEQ